MLYSITSSVRANTETGISRRQIGWLLTLENTVDVGGGALVELDIIHAVGCQTAVRREITERIDIGQPVPMRE